MTVSAEARLPVGIDSTVVVGLFDWDSARPAPPRSDVAYALEWLTPFEDDPLELARRGFVGEPDRRRRVRAFLDAHGWDEPLDVVEAVVHRQQLAVDEVVHLGRAGHEPHASWVAQRWPTRWRTKSITTRRLARQVDDEEVVERQSPLSWRRTAAGQRLVDRPLCGAVPLLAPLCGGFRCWAAVRTKRSP